MTAKSPQTPLPVDLSNSRRAPAIPASMFGIVLGTAGLANCWHAASDLWHFPSIVGDAIGLVAAIIWACLVVLFAGKWILFSAEAKLELEHPVQCCFVGLVGVSTMLVGANLYSFFGAVAHVLYWAGFIWTALFSLWRSGALWRGGRDATTTTAVLYLPSVAGFYVVGIAGASLGYVDLAKLSFGAGFFSWLAIESVLLNRLLTSAELAEALRPTIGIQLAPPAVGAAAYLSATEGVPDMLAHAMVGYALLQLFLMIRIFPWVLKQPLNASYWAFSFGLTALATDIIRMVYRGDRGILEYLAMPVLVAVSAAIFALALITLRLLLSGKLLPLRPVKP
ncbi:dicarboxylate transporter/tellurite-resistance protein TehA [Ochrobactrum soli]|uniref:Tellurite resistance protein TehA n=1 Tax=Ochrobactrum soli TaxID=2448455 RepID=A0A2P9HEB5_9HYPH|nr:dicarboxylate transporter/tellurite-resistance protein TehA [[Ochrobactrum] soli]SPL62456.1 Tellurite resistance protein TehA [[Ochrobactrum] soli]